MGYRRAPHVAWRKVGEETVLLDLHRNRIFGLNAPGGAVWSALDESGDALAAMHGAAGETARAFLAELAAAGLVEEAASPHPAATAAPQPALPAHDRPAIVWQEGLELVAASCALHPGQSEICDAQPGG